MKFTVFMKKSDEVKEWADKHMNSRDQDGVKIVGISMIKMVYDRSKPDEYEEVWGVRCKASEENYYNFVDKYWDKDNTVGPVEGWGANGAKFYLKNVKAD